MIMIHRPKCSGICSLYTTQILAEYSSPIKYLAIVNQLLCNLSRRHQWRVTGKQEKKGPPLRGSGYLGYVDSNQGEIIPIGGLYVP